MGGPRQKRRDKSLLLTQEHHVRKQRGVQKPGASRGPAVGGAPGWAGSAEPLEAGLMGPPLRFVNHVLIFSRRVGHNLARHTACLLGREPVHVFRTCPFVSPPSLAK